MTHGDGHSEQSGEEGGLGHSGLPADHAKVCRWIKGQQVDYDTQACARCRRMAGGRVRSQVPLPPVDPRTAVRPCCGDTHWGPEPIDYPCHESGRTHSPALRRNGKPYSYCDVCFMDWPCPEAPPQPSRSLADIGDTPAVWACTCGWGNVWPAEKVCGMCGRDPLAAPVRSADV